MPSLILEVDGTQRLGKVLFNASSIPIARAGDEQREEWGVLRLEAVVERRGGDALQTFRMILDTAADGAALVMFAAWLAAALKSDQRASLRIRGKHVSKDEKAIRDFLAALETEDRSS